MEYVFKTKPFAHQHAAWLAGRDRPYYAYLMEMGTGKSKVLTDDIGYNFERGAINAALIIAPKSVCRNWVNNELPTHLPEHLYGNARVVLWSPNHTKAKLAELATLFRAEPLRLHVFVVNPEAALTEKGEDFVKRFLRGHDALMAVDESTLMKSPTSKKSKMLMKLGNLAKIRRILTGSVAPESPLNVFQQFQFLNDGILGTDNFYAFRNRYAVLKRQLLSSEGRFVFRSKQPGDRELVLIEGYQNINELNERMRRHAFVALKKDCLDLPDKVYQTREIELTPEQRKIYERLRDDAMFELSDGRAITAPLVLTRLLRMRQVLCNHVPYDGETVPTHIEKTSARINEILSILEEHSGNAIIWSNFVSSIKEIGAALASQYPGGSAMVHGAVEANERQKHFQSFQAGNLRFLVMHPRTAGHGITLTAANLVIYHDNDWSLELRAQSEDRAHRIGQRSNVTYIDLVAPGTVEEKILSGLRKKQSLSDTITGEGWKELFQ